MSDYIKILNKLREANISSEIYPGNGNLKKQMEYANKIKLCAIFYGDNEIKNKILKLRNLKTGEEISTNIINLVNEIKKLSEKILKIIKSKGFKSIELEPVLESKYILQRFGENFRKFMFSFYDSNEKNFAYDQI